MTEIELIIDLHRDAPRQGPGSEEETLKALSYINPNRNNQLRIADIGCGSGSQTITLAQHINGQITAVDLFPSFLDRLNLKAKELNLEAKITTLECSMEDLPFEMEEFDIIWSEGAIYNMGFEEGIKSWQKYLKPGGFLAVSEITWLTDSRPDEIEEYWTNYYPQIDTASNKLNILEENGYALAGYFVLSPVSWLKNYYKPLQDRYSAFLERNHHSDLAKSIVESEMEEIRIYQEYKDFFGYGFYIASKVE